MSKNVILRKLDLITAELAKLRELAKLSRDEYLGDYTKFYTGQRIIEKIVGAAIDINIAVIVLKGEKIPDTYYDSFLVAGRLGVFPSAFAEKIADSARLRNKIIHEYEDIDEQKIYDSLREAIIQYTKYVKYIQEFLKPAH